MAIKKQQGSKVMARVALEAVRGEKTLSETGRAHGIHLIHGEKWRKELLERAHELFADKRRREEQTPGVSELTLRS